MILIEDLTGSPIPLSAIHLYSPESNLIININLRRYSIVSAKNEKVTIDASFCKPETKSLGWSRKESDIAGLFVFLHIRMMGYLRLG